MAQSLGLLLDKARGAREVLPHLAALERALLEHGMSAVERVPEQWVGRICSQLSSLPLPDQDPPLHDLLQRLMRRLNTQPAAWPAKSSSRPCENWARRNRSRSSTPSANG